MYGVEQGDQVVITIENRGGEFVGVSTDTVDKRFAKEVTFSERSFGIDSIWLIRWEYWRNNILVSLT